VTGALKAGQSDRFGPPQMRRTYNFKIAHMAPEGEKVKPGDVLLKFDSQQIEEVLRDELNQLEQINKELEKKLQDIKLEKEDRHIELEIREAELRKMGAKAVLDPELASMQEVKLAQLDLELAEKEVAFLKEKIRYKRELGEIEVRILKNKKAKIESRLEEKQRYLKDHLVSSTREGVVVYLTKFNDEKFKVGESVWRGQMVLEIPNLSSMEVEGAVSEVEAGRVKIGDGGRIRIDALGDQSIPVQVTDVGTIAYNKSREMPSKVVDVALSLEEIDEKRMRPGMNLKGDIIAQEFRDALTVPLEAVIEIHQKSAVFVLEGGEPRLREVEVLTRTREKAVIGAGLEEGEKVWLDPDPATSD